ncbi:MAG: 1,4-alpha-glucan branching protein GlgB [Deltaproteobacteria bacterium]|nr:1,4-alpha-glucan branching protein GlgB [Deltaproteobacteria bacterium]
MKPAEPRATSQQPNSRLTDFDLHLFNEGNHFHIHDKLGAHLEEVDGTRGVQFGVWAPNARYVSVVGDFNAWDRASHPLARRQDSGIWEGFVAGLEKGSIYKFHVASGVNDYQVEKADPIGFLHETPPRTASMVWDLDYEWSDGDWMRARAAKNALDAPMSIYEMHAGSWMRVPEEGFRSLTYRELADKLVAHVKAMGFTHVELMPVMEHPLFRSWGYQVTGYFACTHRYGTPQDLMFLIDTLHRNDIGVIVDWVPAHFPSDEHGLGYFDGTYLYEHADPKQGFHPDWKSLIFNYGRNEVRSFLLSSAFFWLERYHVDGLRVDGVASMLYLDYSRKEGEWIPNRYGGRENLDAIELLRRLNTMVYERFPDVQTIAEESTAWPMVSRPTYVGGLGFGLKWDMGWMHDSLEYFSLDGVHRKFHHDQITFRTVYAASENFVLPLSHDEVVHGKSSLLGKMPGDRWQKFANLRLLYAWMYAQPGKKLLFMGAELAPWKEWDEEASLDWDLLRHVDHEGVRRWLAELNRFYREEPALHQCDCVPEGFEWVDCRDADHSVVSFLRKPKGAGAQVLASFNFTPVMRVGYRIGVPFPGRWRERLNSDAHVYAGSGAGNFGGVVAEPVATHGRPYSAVVTLPPLGALFLVGEPPAASPPPVREPTRRVAG